MNKRIIAAMASMFLFTFVAKAEIMDLGIKLHTAVWAPRKIVTTKETYKDEKNQTVLIEDTNSYYYADGAMSGFINGRYGLALEPLFNIGYGIKLGIGAGVYWDPMGFSNTTKSEYDANAKQIGTDVTNYLPSSPERKCTFDKANRISIIPQLLIKWEFVDLDPITLYAIGKAGLSMPITFANLTYDNLNKDSSKETGSLADVKQTAEELSYHWLSNLLNFEAGVGMRWIGIEAELLGGMFNDTWHVTQKQPSYAYFVDDKKVMDSTKVSSTKSSSAGDTRDASYYTYGVMLQLGYNLELF